MRGLVGEPLSSLLLAGEDPAVEGPELVARLMLEGGAILPVR